MSLDTDALREYVELTDRKRTIEAERRDINDRLDKLEEKLLSQFEEQGMQNIKIGGASVYLHRQLWAKPKDGDKPKAVEALKRAGLDEMVKETFNVHTVSAYFREAEANEQPTPPELDDAFDLNETYSLRVRRG